MISIVALLIGHSSSIKFSSWPRRRFLAISGASLPKATKAKIIAEIANDLTYHTDPRSNVCWRRSEASGSGVENRQRLLKYKRDLEIELRRVNASLEDGTEKKFKRNKRARARRQQGNAWPDCALLQCEPLDDFETHVINGIRHKQGTHDKTWQKYLAYLCG
jgi:hypothetical protein